MNKVILTKSQKNLVVNLEKYVIEYCNMHNLNITINYILNVNYINFICNDDDIFDFTITYKEKKYNYIIKLDDNKFVLYNKNND